MFIRLLSALVCLIPQSCRKWWCCLICLTITVLVMCWDSWGVVLYNQEVACEWLLWMIDANVDLSIITIPGLSYCNCLQESWSMHVMNYSWIIKYDMNALYSYVHAYNFGESPGLAIILSDFYQILGLKNNCHVC